jgi:hypothetical protein
MKVALLSIFCLSLGIACGTIPVCAVAGESAQFMSALVACVFGYVMLSAVVLSFIALTQPKEAE